MWESFSFDRNKIRRNEKYAERRIEPWRIIGRSAMK
jgi:hypothetical protein